MQFLVSRVYHQMHSVYHYSVFGISTRFGMNDHGILQQILYGELPEGEKLIEKPKLAYKDRRMA